MQLRPLGSTELLPLQALTGRPDFADEETQALGCYELGPDPELVSGGSGIPAQGSVIHRAALPSAWGLCLVPRLLGAELQKVRAGFQVSSRRFLQPACDSTLGPEVGAGCG